MAADRCVLATEAAFVVVAVIVAATAVDSVSIGCCDFDREGTGIGPLRAGGRRLAVDIAAGRFILLAAGPRGMRVGASELFAAVQFTAANSEPGAASVTVMFGAPSAVLVMLLVEERARLAVESAIRGALRAWLVETRAMEPIESDLAPVVFRLTRVSLASDFLRNQSMTFLAAELETVLCASGSSAC